MRTFPARLSPSNRSLWQVAMPRCGVTGTEHRHPCLTPSAVDRPLTHGLRLSEPADQRRRVRSGRDRPHPDPHHGHQLHRERVRHRHRHHHRRSGRRHPVPDASYTYNPTTGLLLTTTAAATAFQPATSATTGYDDFGRVTSYADNDQATGTQANTTTSSYDAAGRPGLAAVL
jgi:hypothetical protein